MEKTYDIDAVANYIIDYANSKKYCDLTNLKINYILCLIEGLSLTEYKSPFIANNEFMTGKYSPLSSIYQELNREYGASPVTKNITRFSFDDFKESTPSISVRELIEIFGTMFITKINRIIDMIANKNNHSIYMNVMQLYKQKDFEFDSMTNKQIMQFYQEVSKFEDEIVESPLTIELTNESVVIELWNTLGFNVEFIPQTQTIRLKKYDVGENNNIGNTDNNNDVDNKNNNCLTIHVTKHDYNVLNNVKIDETLQNVIKFTQNQF